MSYLQRIVLSCLIITLTTSIISCPPSACPTNAGCTSQGYCQCSGNYLFNCSYAGISAPSGSNLGILKPFFSGVNNAYIINTANNDN
jgi:hypothetical protein